MFTKLVALRRIGHVDDIAAEAGTGPFAGLSTIPRPPPGMQRDAARRLGQRLQQPPSTEREDAEGQRPS
ncbi:MAG: hypothetical protein ACRDUY_13400 [Nitriliruptorales bacterium]